MKGLGAQNGHGYLGPKYCGGRGEGGPIKARGTWGPIQWCSVISFSSRTGAGNRLVGLIILLTTHLIQVVFERDQNQMGKNSTWPQCACHNILVQVVGLLSSNSFRVSNIIHKHSSLHKGENLH